MAALGQLLNECGIGVAVENEDPEDEGWFDVVYFLAFTFCFYLCTLPILSFIDPLSSIPVEMPHRALIFCQWKSSVQLVSGALSR